MFHEQILDQLKKLETEQLTYQQLEEWLLSHLQQILDSREEQAINLANELDALFIEEGEGLRSEEEMLRDMALLYNREMCTAWIVLGVQGVRLSSERTVHKQWGEPKVVTGFNTGLLVA